MDETKTDSPTDGRPRRAPIELTFSLPQLAGGALAAATAAAIGAQLGVAGTIVGAAVASLVGGVAGTLYSAGLDRTHRTVSTAISKRRTGVVQSDASTEDQGLLLPSEESSGQPSDQSDDTLIDLATVPAEAEPASDPKRRARVWAMVAISTVAIFVLALAAISLIELGLGRALDGGSGTTVGQVVRPPASSPSVPPPTPSHSGSSEPASTPTQTPTEPATPTATPTEPSPSTTPTSAPTEPAPASPTAADPGSTPTA